MRTAKSAMSGKILQFHLTIPRENFELYKHYKCASNGCESSLVKVECVGCKEEQVHTLTAEKDVGQRKF